MIYFLFILSKDEHVSLGECSNGTVRKEHAQGGSKAFVESNIKDVNVSDVDDVKKAHQLNNIEVTTWQEHQ